MSVKKAIGGLFLVTLSFYCVTEPMAQSFKERVDEIKKKIEDNVSFQLALTPPLYVLYHDYYKLNKDITLDEIMTAHHRDSNKRKYSMLHYLCVGPLDFKYCDDLLRGYFLTLEEKKVVLKKLIATGFAMDRRMCAPGRDGDTPLSIAYKTLKSLSTHKNVPKQEKEGREEWIAYIKEVIQSLEQLEPSWIIKYRRPLVVCGIAAFIGIVAWQVRKHTKPSRFLMNFFGRAIK